MNDEEQIKELYRFYWKYMIDKDVKGLHEIHSEDYFLCHMTGIKQTREEFENGLLNGTFNYFSADHDSIEVMIDGNTAEMIGCSKVVASVYGGGKGSWRLKGTFTLRKQNETWKMTSSKASTY